MVFFIAFLFVSQQVVAFEYFTTKYVQECECKLNLPNPRLVSNTLGQQIKKGNNDNISSVFVYFGQFIDHDITLTPTNSSEPDFIEMVHDDDLYYWNINGSMEFFKSQKDLININTNALDLSNVYGDTSERLSLLMEKNTPFLKIGNDGLIHRDENGNFICGDIRCNENTILIGFHTLFLLEHNRLAKKIQEKNQDLTNEEIFEKARKINVYQYKKIIYEEWLPLLLGLEEFPFQSTHLYSDTYFSTVTFRFGHSLIPDHILFKETRESLFDHFFQPLKITNMSILTEYMIGVQKVEQEEFDLEMVDSLRNHLFPSSYHRLDLFALNVKRGRDHKLGSFLKYANIVCHNANSIICFYKITQNMQLAKKLKELYKSAHFIDNFVGILSEPRYKKSLLGKTATKSILHHFQALAFDYQPNKYNSVKTLKQLFEIHFESCTDDIFHI